MYKLTGGVYMVYREGVGVMKTFAQKHYKLLVLAVAGLFVASIAAANLGVSADSSSIDFESPAYSLGNIDGQDGWTKTGGYDVEVADTTAIPEFSDQSLRISNAVTSGSFGDHAFSKPLTDEAGEAAADNGGLSGGTRSDYFAASLDFTSANPSVEQTGLSLNISPDRGDGARMSYVGLRDVTDGLEVFFYEYLVGPGGPAACDGTFPLTVVSSGLDRASVHNVQVEMWFNDGPSNDVVTVTVNGTDTYTGTSWEDYFTGCESTTTRTVDSLGFFTRGTAAPDTEGEGFYIDNIALTTEQADTEAPEQVDGMTIIVDENDLGCYPVINTRDIVVDWNDSVAADLDYYQYQADADTVAPFDFTTNVNASERAGTIRDEDGTYNYRVRAVDTSGNMGEWSEWCGVTLDREDPEVVLTNPEAGDVLSGEVEFMGEITDDNNQRHRFVVRDSDNERVYTSGNIAGTDPVVAASVLFDTKEYEDGEYRVILIGFDEANNNGRDATRVTFDNYVDNKKECKKGGWRRGVLGQEFRNQGDCVSHFSSDKQNKFNPDHWRGFWWRYFRFFWSRF